MGVILEGDEVVDVGVEEKHRPPEPPADPERAPKGWRYDRDEKSWVPRVRAPKIRDAARGRGEEGSEEEENDRPDSAWADGPDGKDLHPDGPGPVELTLEMRNDIEAVLELVVGLPLSGLAVRDPYCGGAFEENWDRIRERSLPLIARSPSLVEWLTKAGGARDWLLFAAAVRPVGVAVYRHHIVHTVSLEETPDGVAAREEDLSAYAA